MVFKKIIFQNRYVALETPSRPPPPFMANAFLNFHFDFLHTSLTSLTWVKNMSANNCYGYLPFMGFIQKIALYVQYPEYIQCPPSLTATNIKPTVSDGLRYVLQFLWGKGSETKITWVGLGCVLQILKILNGLLVQMVQVCQKENPEIYFFQGQSLLMCIMDLPWPGSLAPPLWVGKETISCAPRKPKLSVLHNHSIPMLQ